MKHDYRIVNSQPETMIYVAGPYSAPTREGVETDIAEAIAMGVEVARLGYYPVIPHANTPDEEFNEVQPYPFWIRGTLKLLSKCDAIFLLPGWKNSPGTRGELRFAIDSKIPILHSLNDLRSLSRYFWDGRVSMWAEILYHEDPDNAFRIEGMKLHALLNSISNKQGQK